MNPIPENGGLSQLADEARNLGLTADAATYPVRRRGEKRRLIPNQAGIAWLEKETAEDCEIYHVDHPDPDGLRYTFARGQRHKTYSRPMFQVVHDGAGFGTWSAGTSCQCGDFSRSWNCPDHQELKWNASGHYWERPCTGLTDCSCGSCRTDWREPQPVGLAPYLATPRAEPETPVSLYDRVVEYVNQLENGRGLYDQMIRSRLEPPADIQVRNIEGGVLFSYTPEADDDCPF